MATAEPFGSREGGPVKTTPKLKTQLELLRNKVERASSNPFDNLQSREGRQGLGCTDVPTEVKADSVVVSVNEPEMAHKVIREAYRQNCAGIRKKRSSSGIKHDGKRLRIYINSKISKVSLSAARSLSASAATYSNSTNLLYQQKVDSINYKMSQNQKRFFFEYSQCEFPSDTSLKGIINNLSFVMPSVQQIVNAKFNDLAYLEQVSPDLLRHFVVIRLLFNSVYQKHPHDADARNSFIERTLDEIKRLASMHGKDFGVSASNRTSLFNFENQKINYGCACGRAGCHRVLNLITGESMCRLPAQKVLDWDVSDDVPVSNMYRGYEENLFSTDSLQSRIKASAVSEILADTKKLVTQY